MAERSWLSRAGRCAVTVYQLDPDATLAGGVLTNVTGGPGIWQVLSDASSSTFIWAPSPTPGPIPSAPPTRVRLSNSPTLPVGSQVRRVQPFVAGQVGTSSFTAYFGVDVGSTLGINAHPRRYSALPGGPAATSGSVGGEPLTVRPDGLPWDQASLDDLDLFLTSGSPAWLGPGAFHHRISQAYVEVEVNERPIPNLTGPGVLTPTSTPTILWTYTDPENDPQDAYDLRVFPLAIAVAPGFDPETSPGAVIATGTVYANVRRYDITSANLLQPGSYVAYIKVADVGSGLRWSGWQQRTFTVFYALPPPATILATANPAGDRVDLSITWPAPSTSVAVERSIDGGVTWVPLRWGMVAVNPAGGTVAIADYEAPLGVPIIYRVQAYVSSGTAPLLITQITSWSAPTAPVELPLGWWLTDPYQPIGNSIPLVLRAGPLKMDRRERISFSEPLGRERAVWTSDTVLGEEISLELLFLTEDAWTAFQVLRGRQTTLLLRTGMAGLSWYVRLGQGRETELHVWPHHGQDVRTRIVSLVATEVDD